VDYPGDPNCVDPWDPSEIAGPCEDGLDNDDDGLIDFPDDPGCQSLDGQLENPQCQDGIDNNGDGTLDFDGGASANGGVPLGDPDPSCGAAWWDFEFSFGCIGFFC
jgi:hypothetical protein